MSGRKLTRERTRDGGEGKKGKKGTREGTIRV